MKRIFSLLLFVLALNGYTNAQGNLQFNQVIVANLNSTVSSYSTITSTTITVPAGKVWKIEHADVWLNNSTRQTLSGYYSLYIDNIVLHHSKGSSGTSNQFAENFPVWLPAGTYTVYISNEDSSTHNYVGTINAIEFNVIP